MTRRLAAAALATLALGSPVRAEFGIPQPQQPYTLVQGEECPPGTVHVSFAEASANRQQLCSRLGQWDIRRLADGAAMDGPGYKCALRNMDTRPMGGSVCRPAAVAVAPPPPALVPQPRAWPPSNGQPAFSCVPGLRAPVRLFEGEVQCASNNGRDCLWNACNESAPQATRWQPAGPIALQPLTCGAEHRVKLGIDGYSQPGHWCRSACEIFNCGRLGPQVVVQQPPRVIVSSPPPGVVVSPPPAVIVSPPHVVFTPPNARVATGEEDFKGVLAAVAGETFPEDKQRVLSAAARTRWFSVDQVLALYDQEGYDYDKVAALELLAPRLVDRQNGFKLVAAMTFDSEKDKAQQILDRR